MTKDTLRQPADRQPAFSEAFKAFICTDWAPYDESLPRACLRPNGRACVATP